jgi:lysophospholipase L1-like esterase
MSRTSSLTTRTRWLAAGIAVLITLFTLIVTHAAASPRPPAPSTAFSDATIAGFAARAEAGEPLSVVFFGGSLTWGANASDPNTTSYRGRMMRWLREKYPRSPFTFHDAAIGGTGSALGLFRLDRDVLAHKPDFVFLDFTVNDGITGTDEYNLASYERIVRDLRAAGAVVLPVFTCMQAQMAGDSSAQPARMAAHQKLADAYGLATADIMAGARAAIAAKRADPVKMYPIGKDRTHPDDSGYEIFFEAVRDAFLHAIVQPRAGMPAAVPAATLYPDLYPNRTRTVLVNHLLPRGWSRVHTYRNAMWYDNLSSRWMGDVACVTGANAAPLEIKFRGSFVGMIGERSPLTPPFRVWIDGAPVPQHNSQAADPFLWNINTMVFDSARSRAGCLFAWTMITKKLPDGEHTLRIVPDFTNAAEGAELRIESICSAGR